MYCRIAPAIKKGTERGALWVYESVQVLFRGVLLTEVLDATSGIDELLFAGIERMAAGADFDLQVVAYRGARLKGVAARAGNVDLFVLRVNAGLHNNYPLIDRRVRRV